LSEHDRDVELFGGVLFTTLLLAVLVSAALLPPDLTPICLFHRLTGLPCPACGTARALRLLLTGHPVTAWLTQPLAITLFILAAVFAAYSWVVVLFRLPRLRFDGVTQRQRAGAWVILCGTLVLNWLYLIVTLP
jgi:hypothetical protein